MTDAGLAIVLRRAELARLLFDGEQSRKQEKRSELRSTCALLAAQAKILGQPMIEKENKRGASRSTCVEPSLLGCSSMENKAEIKSS
jgi:hypothetical protein